MKNPVSNQDAAKPIKILAENNELHNILGFNGRLAHMLFGRDAATVVEPESRLNGMSKQIGLSAFAGVARSFIAVAQIVAGIAKAIFGVLTLNFARAKQGACLFIWGMKNVFLSILEIAQITPIVNLYNKNKKVALAAASSPTASPGSSPSASHRSASPVSAG